MVKSTYREGERERRSERDRGRSNGRAAAPPPNPSGIDIWFVLGVLRRWWKVVVPVGLLAGTVAGAAIALSFQPTYQAKVLLWIDSEPQYLVQPNPSAARGFVDNQLGLIRSSLVLGPALGRQEIASLPEVAAAAEPVNALRNHVGVAKAFGRDHYYLTGSAKNPQHAALLANAVADVYLELVDDFQNDRDKDLVRLLEEERVASEREVNRLRDNVQQLTIAQTGRDPFAFRPDIERMDSLPLAQIQGQLTSLRVEEVVLRSQILAVQQYLSESPNEVPEDVLDGLVAKHDGVRGLAERIAGLRRMVEEIEDRSTRPDEVPLYRSAKTQIPEEEEKLDELKKTVREKSAVQFLASLKEQRANRLSDLESRLKELLVRKQALETSFSLEVEKIRQYSGEDLTLQMARADLSRASDVLNRISGRIFMLRTEQRAPKRVALLEPAQVPQRPVEILPLKNIGLAFAASFAVPFLLALLWDFGNRQIVTPEQVQQQSQLPVVGEIATLPLTAGGGRYFRRNSSRRQLRLFEESVEALRMFLVLTADLREARVLAICSAATQEGKTTVASQLAISLARSSSGTTLLVDGDLRAPSIHEVFERQNERGLVEVLRGEATLADVVVTDWHEHLHLLHAGKLHGSPHKLLTTDSFTRFLDETRARYDYVVFDTAPVLAAAESLVIAAQSDATLVCTRKDVSRQEQVRKACERLSGADANVVGCVFSGIPLSHYRYRYGGYYYGEERS
jgi:polysaccharide biosynthesis transport protein